MGDVQTILKDSGLELIKNHVFLAFPIPQNTANMADLHLWVRKSFQGVKSAFILSLQY